MRQLTVPTPAVDHDASSVELAGDHRADRANPQNTVIYWRATDAALTTQRPPGAGADGDIHPGAWIRTTLNLQADRPVARIEDQHRTDQVIYGDAGDKNIPPNLYQADTRWQ